MGNYSTAYKPHTLAGTGKDPFGDFDSLKTYIEHLNASVTANLTYFSAHFGIKVFQLEVRMSEKNILPNCWRTALMNKAISGIKIILTYRL